MVNQTITTNKNHDELTGRAAGEDITIQLGAKLTIDSMPHLTPMGILGDILLTKGEVHIDGTKVREVTYNTGSGAMPTAIPTTVNWTGGTGKIIRYNSGTNVAGTITLTVLTGVNPTGTITDGTWSATVATDKVGFLIVYGEDQVWDATDATCTMRITGDWYEIGLGTGADNQSINIGHNGWQHAVWVETGSGTGIYKKWHRVLQNGVNGAAVSAVFWDAVADFGNTYETGFVFYNDRSAQTITFGTSTNGGIPLNGAKIRIPNVHLGTTTTAAPTTEYVGVTLGSMLEVVDSAVTENVFIDHLNASTVHVSLVQTNGGTISDSCFGMWTAANIINKCNATVNITNCAFVSGCGLTGDSPVADFIIQDNVGGVNISDCVFYCGTNGTTGTGGIYFLTMANAVVDDCKFVANQQDENSVYSIRGSVASNIELTGDSIFLNAGLILSAGCVNWEVENFIYSQLTSRGATEDAMTMLSITGADQVTIQGGRFAVGNGVRHPNTNFCAIADASNITVRNFGEVDAKIACGGRGTTVVNLSGITNNCLFQRLYFSGRNTALPFTMLNSCADITFENCSCDYNDELESMANRVMMKGIHGASGNIGTATGWEDDYINVLASIFYDCFKSDTAGGVGLLFNDRGVKHLGDVTIDSGTPEWNGLGDLLMLTAGDQITFEHPYWIKGHNGFTSILPHLLGVNCGTLGSSWGNFEIYFALDTGSGYGNFELATVANLTNKTISASGFKIKTRILCITGSATNSIRGLQIHTSTTIADQKANLYPLSVSEVTLTGLVSGSEVRAYLGTDPATATEIAGIESSGTSFSFNQSNAGQAGYIVVFALGYQAIRFNYTYTSSNVSIPITQIVDRQFNNPV